MRTTTQTQPDQDADALRVKQEAWRAAEKYDDINAACHYPFGTTDAQIFCREFEFAKTIIDGLEVTEHDNESEVFCCCDLIPTPHEIDSGRCSYCGKVLQP